MIGQLAVFYGNCLPVKIRPQLCADCVHFPNLTSPATNAGYIRQIQILGILGIIFDQMGHGFPPPCGKC